MLVFKLIFTFDLLGFHLNFSCPQTNKRVDYGTSFLLFFLVCMELLSYARMMLNKYVNVCQCFLLNNTWFADWGPKVDVVGFCFLDLASNYEPPEPLVKWLEAGDKPIYIGFGSLVSSFFLTLFHTLIYLFF